MKIQMKNGISFLKIVIIRFMQNNVWITQFYPRKDVLDVNMDESVRILTSFYKKVIPLMKTSKNRGRWFVDMGQAFDALEIDTQLATRPRQHARFDVAEVAWLANHFMLLDPKVIFITVVPTITVATILTNLVSDHEF